MSREDRNALMTSFDTISELLREVVVKAREKGADDTWMLNYLLAEVPYIFRKETSDVQVP